MPKTKYTEEQQDMIRAWFKQGLKNVEAIKRVKEMGWPELSKGSAKYWRKKAEEAGALGLSLEAPARDLTDPAAWLARVTGYEAALHEAIKAGKGKQWMHSESRQLLKLIKDYAEGGKSTAEIELEAVEPIIKGLAEAANGIIKKYVPVDERDEAVRDLAERLRRHSERG